KSWGENPDNGVGIVVELHLLPQNSRIPAKPSGPQTVADHGGFGEALRFVTRAKHSPKVRGSAEQGKAVRTHLQQFAMLRTLPAGQVRRAALGNSHLLEDARP